MCEPTSIALAALSVASTVTSSINSAKQAKATRRSQTDAINRQNQALRESIERSKLFDEERKKTLEENINQFDPDKQEKALDEQVANTEGKLSDLLQRANASKSDVGDIGGKVSNTFTIADGQSQAKTASKAANRNTLLARQLSHNNLALQNSIDNANFATRFSEVGNAQRRRAKADQKVTEAAGIVKTPKTNSFLNGLDTALQIGDQLAGSLKSPKSPTS
jgi:type II secretory pathway pseudopilin PulG